MGLQFIIYITVVFIKIQSPVVIIAKQNRLMDHSLAKTFIL